MNGTNFSITQSAVVRSPQAASQSMWNTGSSDLFSNKQIALLIELVEALPVLYAADKKMFKGIIPREKAWRIIAEKLNKTVTECEKKWRYLRDKYVKERRRLQDESKVTGRESKSSWQHYESMEFLSTHLRLPVGGADRNSSLNMDEEDLQGCSQDSNLIRALSTPPSNPDLAVVKSEMDSRLQNHNSWPPAEVEKPDQNGRSFKPLAPPPNYPGFLNRPVAPGPFASNPLFAMWSNSIAQAHHQHQQHQLSHLVQNIRPPVATSVSNPSPPASDTAVGNDDTGSEPRAKKPRASSTQDVNINVSFKDFAIPAESLSEYHFCVSLAQMMESVPISYRPDLRIKLMQTVKCCHQNPPQHDNQNPHSPNISP